MISTGQRILLITFGVLLLLFGCGDETTEPTNNDPSTPTISPASATVEPGATIVFSASATDPDNDALSYTWTFAAGTPLSATGERVSWTAPAQGQSVSISVEASDNKGGKKSNSISVGIGAEAAFLHTIPDSITLEPNLSGLFDHSKGLDKQTGICHAISAFAVGYANTVVFVFTALPKLAFLSALTQPVAWIPPSTWTWNYSVETAQDTALIELTGTVPDQHFVEWEMRVSGTRAELDHFLWVSGESRLDATEGYWILYDANAPIGDQDALRVEWFTQALDNRSLDFLNVNASSADFGDTLSYEVQGVDATVRFNDVSTEKIIWATWDLDIGDGQLFWAGGDSSCCWGPAPQFQDTPCE